MGHFAAALRWGGQLSTGADRRGSVHQTGTTAVLRLRALRSSGDFDAYWAFHEAQEWQRTHQQRYADGQVPTLRHPHSEQRPPLRLVK